MLYEEKHSALEENEWLQLANTKFLTIGDFKKMKKNSVHKFALFDRNLTDVTHDNTLHKIYEPKDFFKKCYKSIYTHYDGLFGEIIDTWGNHSKQISRIDYWQIFVKEIDCWHVLTEGCIRAIFPYIDYPPGIEGKKWNEFSDDTLVGWRGPMMYESDLEKMPSIFINEDS